MNKLPYIIPVVFMALVVAIFWLIVTNYQDKEDKIQILINERDSLQSLCNSWEKEYRDLDTKCDQVIQMIPDSAIEFMRVLSSINDRREKEHEKTLAELESCINSCFARDSFYIDSLHARITALELYAEMLAKGRAHKAWRISQENGRYWRDRYYDCVKRLPQKEFLKLRDINLKQKRVMEGGSYYNVWNGHYYEIN